MNDIGQLILDLLLKQSKDPNQAHLLQRGLEQPERMNKRTYASLVVLLIDNQTRELVGLEPVELTQPIKEEIKRLMRLSDFLLINGVGVVRKRPREGDKPEASKPEGKKSGEKKPVDKGAKVSQAKVTNGKTEPRTPTGKEGAPAKNKQPQPSKKPKVEKKPEPPTGDYVSGTVKTLLERLNHTLPDEELAKVRTDLSGNLKILPRDTAEVLGGFHRDLVKHGGGLADQVLKGGIESLFQKTDWRLGTGDELVVPV